MIHTALTHAVAIGRIGPGQQQTGAQLGEPAAAHALGNQRALVLRNSAADLQQQVVMRIIAHGAIQEFGSTSGLRPFLQEDHLVHIVAGEAVGGGDEHAVDLAALHGIAQVVQPRAGEDRAAVAVVAEHVRWVEAPALGGMGMNMSGKPPELLLNGLVVDLVAGRNAAIDCYPHGRPPAGLGTPVPRSAPGRSSPTAEGADTPGPSAAGPWASARWCVERARRVAADPRMLSSPVSDLTGELGRHSPPEPMARPRPAELKLPCARQAELVICD